MKKNLLAVTLAVLFGLVAMITPVYIWHQVNYPDKPLTLQSLRGETMDSPSQSWKPSEYWNRWTPWLGADSTSTFPLCLTFAFSFLASVSTYLLSKRRF